MRRKIHRQIQKWADQVGSDQACLIDATVKAYREGEISYAFAHRKLSIISSLSAGDMIKFWPG